MTITLIDSSYGYLCNEGYNSEFNLLFVIILNPTFFKNDPKIQNFSYSEYRHEKIRVTRTEILLLQKGKSQSVQNFLAILTSYEL